MRVQTAGVQHELCGGRGGGGIHAATQRGGDPAQKAENCSEWNGRGERGRSYWAALALTGSSVPALVTGECLRSDGQAASRAAPGNVSHRASCF